MLNNNIQDELAKIVRRIDQMQKTLDLLFHDREILENIQGRLTAVEERLSLNNQHSDVVRKDIKEEINLANDRTVAAVETKVDEIYDEIKKKKVITVRTPWWRRWFKK